MIKFRIGKSLEMEETLKLWPGRKERGGVTAKEYGVIFEVTIFQNW